MLTGLGQDGMIELTANKYGKSFPAIFTLVEIGLDGHDRVRWLLVRAHSDESGLVAALTLAYAGLANIGTIGLMNERGVYAGLYQVELRYANE